MASTHQPRHQLSGEGEEDTDAMGKKMVSLEALKLVDYGIITHSSRKQEECENVCVDCLKDCDHFIENRLEVIKSRGVSHGVWQRGGEETGSIRRRRFLFFLSPSIYIPISLNLLLTS